ncbi:MAG: ElyC/SanA/YdcF family protein [Verrucomicrobiota bacterium]
MVTLMATIARVYGWLTLKRFRGWQRFLGNLLLWTPVLALVGLLFCNLWVVQSTESRVARLPGEVTANPVGVVLGTSKKFRSGGENLHFKHRMEAAASLYKSGKVKHLLVSGHNPSKNYNEPQDMVDSLVALGVPREAITCDYAGRRTLDSVVRAHRVFGQVNFTVISDDFHVSRALFLADRLGLKTVGLASKPVPYNQSAPTQVREVLARVKAVLDVCVLDTQPRFLGDPVKIELTAVQPASDSPQLAPASGAKGLD